MIEAYSSEKRIEAAAADVFRVDTSQGQHKEQHTGHGLDVCIQSDTRRTVAGRGKEKARKRDRERVTEKERERESDRERERERE